MTDLTQRAEEPPEIQNARRLIEHHETAQQERKEQFAAMLREHIEIEPMILALYGGASNAVGELLDRCDSLLASVEQLLSENRQVRAELDRREERARAGGKMAFEEAHREMRQDLDRISAEREAYREAAQYLAHCVETDLSLDRPSATRTRSALASLRRILAENDR